METKEIDYGKLKVARFMCQTELLFHTRYFFMDQQHRKFVIGAHHEIICNALERVLTGRCKRLIINIAPRYGKTELAVKMFISHALSLNPAAKFIHLSYADDLALDNSLAIRDMVTSDAYQTLFPEVKIRKDAKATNKWYTTEGGGVLARAAGGQVTGFGAGIVDEELSLERINNELDEFTPDDTELDDKFKFGGGIIIDDAIKPEDADSDTIRVKINERFESTIRNRVNSRNTPIIVIGQRLHPMDLPGYLQRPEELDQWEVISLPCINAAGNTFGLEPGSALWPFKHTLAELKAMKKANDINYERQYNQNPSPKAGLMFPLDELNFYDHRGEFLNDLDDPDASYMPCDPANLGGDDFAGLVTKLIGARIYVVDVLYNTDGADVNEGAVVEMAMEQDMKRVGVEAVFGWAAVADRIKAKLNVLGWDNEFALLRPRTGKPARINAASSFIRNNFWFRADYMDLPQYRRFMENLTSYLKIQEPGKINKHDDAPDVCQMGASYYERTYKDVFVKANVSEATDSDE